jgi:DNA-binding response OmpR family regulator
MVTSRRTATVLVYSSSEVTRRSVRSALGDRPTETLEIRYVEATTGPQVIAALDAGGLDLAVLDGEAAPTGGMGLARQLRDEIDSPPPVLLLVGRRDDAWLATWSRADSVVPHPLDAVEIIEAATQLLERSPAASH